MAIHRSKHTKNYTVVPNRILKDKNLSIKGKGLLVILLSLPDDWELTIAGLCSITGMGKDSVRKTIKEIEFAGYMKFENVVPHIGYNRHSVDWDVYDFPYFRTSESESENQSLTIRTSESESENSTQLNTNIPSTNELNTYVSITDNKENNQEDEFITGEFPWIEKDDTPFGSD